MEASSDLAREWVGDMALGLGACEEEDPEGIYDPEDGTYGKMLGEVDLEE